MVKSLLYISFDLLGCAKMNKPRLRGRSRFSRISRASVPSSIRSNFVITPIVLNPELTINSHHRIKSLTQIDNDIGNVDANSHHKPCGSTSLEILSASELARSVLAGDMAKMRQFSLLMNSSSMLRIWISMSGGWSPTATFVIPGRSIRVRLRTCQPNA